jgi:lauroyl/myristoyl acyltransferase
MQKLMQVALGVGALLGLALATSAPAAAKCTRAHATGAGITQDMAREMAKMNLDMAVSVKGEKAHGKVHYKCTGDLFAECHARRRVCS